MLLLGRIFENSDEINEGRRYVGKRSPSAPVNTSQTPLAVRTYKEVAAMLDISPARVHQIEASAMKKLRRLLSSAAAELGLSTEERS